MTNYQQNEIIFGFQVKSVVDIPKIHQRVYQLEHQKTGAQMVHFDNEDKNNAFGIGFLTCPQDSSGIAHILEHIVLCGSKNFPVKDPFFSMLKRSLATFMNAFTASDWTMYPYATQNKKDFYNLMSVYTDAVFQPLLKENSFAQEAHRLEKKNGKWDIDGVVFNEMKGAMSSPIEIMYRRTQQAVFPTITYHHNSGGEPLNILDLSLKDLKDFHRIHYHPSNAKFFSYGCFELSEKLNFLHNKILKNYKKSNKKISIGKEKRFSQPQIFSYHYPAIENEEPFYQLALNWLTCSINDPIEVLSLSLLEEILLGSSAAPLRFALVESKLGKDLADTTGYHAEYSETFFSVGLKGVKKENLAKAENLIIKTLKKIANSTIDKFFIASAIHQKEIEIKEISSGRYPYSLKLLFRFIGTWMQEGDITACLKFDEHLQKIKTYIQQENYFEKIIDKYFLKNLHRVKVILEPQKNYLQLQEKEIQVKILKLAKKAKGKKLTEDKKISEAKEIDCLPNLELKEIVLDFPVPKISKKNNIFSSKQQTNKIDYWSFYLENNQANILQEKDAVIIANMITDIGTKNFRYEEFSAKINRYSGGMAFNPLLENSWDGKTYYSLLQFFIKSLEENIAKIKELIEEIFYSYSFQDKKRIRQWIEKTALEKTNSILNSGHLYAAGLACRHFSKISYLEEMQSGIHLVKRLKEIEKLSTKSFTELTNKFEQSFTGFLENANFSFCLCGEDLVHTKKQIMDLKLTPSENWHKRINEQPIQVYKEIWTISSSVCFVVRAYPTIPSSHPDSPLLLLLSKILSANFIHQEVREKGGAYGGVVSFQPKRGNFCFLSYRDPNLLATWEVYTKAIDWVLAGKFTDKQIKNAILQTFADLDKPLSPVDWVNHHYLKSMLGISYQKEKKYRQSILQANKKDLIRVAEKWLIKENYCDVAISNEDRLNSSIKKNYKIYSIL